MKQGQRQAIAHNIADSIASGCSLLLGEYDLPIRHWLATAPDGRIVLDCLAGRVMEGPAKPALEQLAKRLPDAVIALCAKENGSAQDFDALVVTLGSDALGVMAETTVRSPSGNETVDHYVGRPLRRRRMLDAAGRKRRVK